jgi:hypothetical protein
MYRKGFKMVRWKEFYLKEKFGEREMCHKFNTGTLLQ